MLIDDFLSYVLVETPGCPIPMARMQVISAADEFCRQSRCWNEFQDFITLVDGVNEYDIDSPADAVAHVVLGAWVGSVALTPASIAELQLVLPAWRVATGNLPRYYNKMLDRSSIAVYPIPAGSLGAQLSLRVSYAPSASAKTIPDFLAERYREAIASGTKSRLMAMPGQPWSNPSLVSYYRDIFVSGMAIAQAELLHEQSPGLVTVRPRAFGF